MRTCYLNFVLSVLVLAGVFLTPACSLTSGLDKYDDYNFGKRADAGDGETPGAGDGGTNDASTGAWDGGETWWERYERSSREAWDGCSDATLDCAGAAETESGLGCPERCKAVTGRHCFCPFLRRYEEAETICGTAGMHLVRIDDEDENSLLGDLLVGLGATTGNLGGAWIGLDDLDQDGSFSWQNGSEAGYTAWATGQPESGAYPGDRRCVVLEVGEDGEYRWHNQPCDQYEGWSFLISSLPYLLHYFFCESDTGDLGEIANVEGLFAADASVCQPLMDIPGYDVCCTTIADVTGAGAIEPGRCGQKVAGTSMCGQQCQPGIPDFVSGCQSESPITGAPKEAACCTTLGDDALGYMCGTWNGFMGCHVNYLTSMDTCAKPTAYKGHDERLYPLHTCGETECELASIVILASADQCCTDQRSVDEFRAYATDRCGLNYGTGGYGDACIQTGMEGDLDEDCPERDPFQGNEMLEGLAVMPGCCSAFGLCGSYYTGQSECAIYTDPPHRLCIRSKKDPTIGIDPLLLDEYGDCNESVVDRGKAYTLCPGPLDWKQAEAACAWKENRYLVHIDDAEENGFLRSSLTEAAFWIGAYESDKPVTDEWYWSDDVKTPFFSGYGFECTRPGEKNWAVIDDSYVNFAGCNVLDESEAQPDYVPLGEVDTEDCAQMRTDGFWSDEDCALKKAYVCEEAIP